MRTVKTTWGEESAVLATFRDVTERKRVEKELRESEQNFRALADNAKDGILITGEDASIVYSNLRFADMLGYNVNEVFTKDFNGMIKGDAEHGEEVTLEGKGGMTVPVELAASRTLWHGVDATIVIVRNIAERKSREDEQLKASKLESLGTLAGGIAHDFNNLLTAIIGNVSLARLLGCGERGTKALNDADNAAQRAKDLTNQLLTFSRGGAPVKSVTSINGIVTDSASFSVLGSNIKCEIKLPEDLAPVEVDAGQISQVVHNVVLNAVQAMPGGGVITISAENVSLTNESGLPLSPGRYLRIDIRDTGPGIPEEHIGKVFDPYFTTKKGGSGLGLATVYSVVKNHDGYISLDTKPGSGTVFHIYLPASDTELAPQKAKVVEERPSIGRGRVLIMDDEEMIRDIAGKILVELGYEVDYAANGSEALEKYRVRMEAGSPFDAVILDLTIPAGMGGREAIKKLLELDPGARAIVSSGYSNDSIMSEYARFGFKAVIAKPYRIADLSNVVRQVVEGI
ncbi:MAG: hypothetical protein A2V21_310165 [Deltaproteobacteria bacterium GWC2_55_46]|nr:MAG: hypothetical protein A2Z79_04255 [Deltaproteobacteria bacterium GWA2_55_82]OGQ64213.1 MAG: hypothetical protein A3I81_10640 [Deltaproteobacteria bacterium RIFCSPLOWO2_02_FULL_55_12]OIJ75151.1 MAG: hypothetical protein A2V21_310165 [Deltaproteobacteria bacterium GWC2_55_46]